MAGEPRASTLRSRVGKTPVAGVRRTATTDQRLGVGTPASSDPERGYWQAVSRSGDTGEVFRRGDTGEQ
ncbi:hypothetical protein chiPu_0006337 [Chiloscyllium punctatum]|uniref:Uncharacterized protein n=1 Tax=Chiloscyllium punctatum TaxID=137246 RepID=A0A401SBZ6_CHIPU|nr:hypothetical protein [Chiloscyllium punctatum]